METSSVAASAATVLPDGAARLPDSIDGTVARDKPEIMPNRAAETPAQPRSVLSRSAMVAMTTLVAPATNVVKLFPLTPVTTVASAIALELHDRIAWVQRDLGTEDEPASLAVLASIADVSRQVLQQWVAKSKARRHPGRGETFAKCAKAWRVSLEWLQTGVGEPRPSAYGPLEQALELEPWAPPAVAAAKAHYASGAKLSLPEWHRFLRSVHELTAKAAPEPEPRVLRVERVIKRSRRDAG